MVYQFKPQFYLKSDPEAAARECEKLAEQNRLTPAELVNASRPKDAPLHNDFEWNDTAAAEHWREEQARHIIQALVIVSDESEPTRAFVSVKREAGKALEYLPLQIVLDERTLREQMLQKAYADLEAFRRKYNTLQELAGVFEAIERCRGVRT